MALDVNSIGFGVLERMSAMPDPTVRFKVIHGKR
jgi:hypothetical protein